jgi:hypothetical protein
MKNAKDNRFGSFFNRVETERAALKIVNKAFPSCKLHGLTKAAIESWVAHEDILNHRCRKKVEMSLVALSARIDALADQSRVVFGDESFNIIASHQLLAELERSCSK